MSNEPEVKEDTRFIPAPSANELEKAMFVASYAYAVCTQFIEQGRPSAVTFIELCNALYELEGATLGGYEENPENFFFSRAEDMFDFQKRLDAIEHDKEEQPDDPDHEPHTA